MHTCVPLIKIERAMSSLLNLNSWRQDNKTKFKLRLMIITFNRFTRCNDAWRILEASYQQVRYVSRNQDGERFRHKLKEVGKKGEFSIPNAHLNCFPSENCVFFFRFYFFSLSSLSFPCTEHWKEIPRELGDHPSEKMETRTVRLRLRGNFFLFFVVVVSSSSIDLTQGKFVRLPFLSFLQRECKIRREREST